MGGLFNTLLRAMILDDSAYQNWRERPNLFLNGITLIVVVSLIAGLLTFAVGIVERVSLVDEAEIREAIQQSLEWQRRFNPGMQDMPPEAQLMMDQTIDTIVPMIMDIVRIEAPLPRGISGFFQALGAWLSRVLAALGGWLFYGALVLIAVNLLGGSAKLPDFLGMVSLYAVPGLLGLLAPVPCLGAVLGLVGMIWSIVVYVKATAVASGLDGGRAVLAVVAPFVALWLLGILLVALFVIWLVILF